MRSERVISAAMEDYLKAIYKLSDGRDRVSTSQMARHLSCAPASVTNMLKKLSSLRLVKYAPYKGVRLTAAGNKIALEVLRHHRLIELYLTKMLDYGWDEVHEEADRLEHVISEEMEARMDEALGFPDRDPHGDPIPTRDGKVSADSLNCLWECSEGKQFSVARVSDRNPEVLRYLDRIGIYPGMRIRVVKRAPFNGPLSVRVKEETYDLSEELARQIWVCLA